MRINQLTVVNANLIFLTDRQVTTIDLLAQKNMMTPNQEETKRLMAIETQDHLSWIWMVTKMISRWVVVTDSLPNL